MRLKFAPAWPIWGTITGLICALWIIYHLVFEEPKEVKRKRLSSFACVIRGLNRAILGKISDYLCGLQESGR